MKIKEIIDRIEKQNEHIKLIEKEAKNQISLLENRLEDLIGTLNEEARTAEGWGGLRMRIEQLECDIEQLKKSKADKPKRKEKEEKKIPGSYY